MNKFDENLEQNTKADAAFEASEEAFSENAAEKEEKTEVCENNAENNGGEKPFANAIDWICTIVFTAAAVLLVNLFAIRAITVSGASMNNTLKDNDKVITTNLCYSPKFGDVVVIQADKLLNRDTGLYGEPIIKRVIGTAGDTIRFDLDKGEVYRNGELLVEKYISGPTVQKYNGWVESGVDYVVPENCVFVMGDNRKVSHDSRDLRAIGFIDENYIMGKAFVRIYPLNEMKWL